MRDGMSRREAEAIVRHAHARQVIVAQRKALRTLRRRAEKAEADVTYYAGLYEEVLRLCAKANFNPYMMENTP